MFELTIFKSKQYGIIRTMVDKENKKVVFNATDVAKVLGYAAPAKAICDLCKGVTVLVTPTNGGPQKMKYITQGDIYRLAMRSKRPEAEAFQDWVCDVVLPQIQKTGGYVPHNEDDDEKNILARAYAITLRTLKMREDDIAANRPKVLFAESLLSHNPSISMAQMAKLITQNGHHIGRTQLFQTLREQGFIFKRGTLPIQNYVNQGLFELHTSMITVHGRKREVTTTKVTAKGQEYLLRFFRENYL